MNQTIIGPFCELLSDTNILKEHSVLSVISKLKKCYNKTKSDLLLNFSEYSYDDNYIEYFINEIESQDYLKNYGIEKISSWLEDNNLTEKQLDDLTVPVKFQETLGVALNPGQYIENMDTKRLIQESILFYFLNKYASMLIEFLASKKNNTPSMSNKDRVVDGTSISKEILEKIENTFNEISDLNEKLNQEKNLVYGEDAWADTSHIDDEYEPEFAQLNSNMKGLLEGLYYSSNNDNYFYFDCSLKVYNHHYNSRKEEYLKEVLDSSEEDFICSEVKFLTQTSNRKLSMGWFDIPYDSYIEYNDKYRIPLIRKLEFLDSKIRQFDKAIIIEENESYYDPDGYLIKGSVSAKILNKTTSLSRKLQGVIPQEIQPPKEPKTSKQLTVNQIVLLLDKLSFFTHPKIENLPKTKQSELISKICGLNSKNIKGKIENLDKPQKDLGVNHHKDIEMVDDILSNLE